MELVRKVIKVGKAEVVVEVVFKALKDGKVALEQKEIKGSKEAVEVKVLKGT